MISSFFFIILDIKDLNDLIMKYKWCRKKVISSFPKSKKPIKKAQYYYPRRSLIMPAHLNFAQLPVARFKIFRRNYSIRSKIMKSEVRKKCWRNHQKTINKPLTINLLKLSRIWNTSKCKNVVMLLYSNARTLFKTCWSQKGKLYELAANRVNVIHNIT